MLCAGAGVSEAEGGREGGNGNGEEDETYRIGSAGLQLYCFTRSGRCGGGQKYDFQASTPAFWKYHDCSAEILLPYTMRLSREGMGW